MQYIKVTIKNATDEASDMLIALLSDAGFNGFEETENALFAYIEQTGFSPETLAAIADNQRVDYETEIIAPQNWNALWESNFEPVIVDDFCTIRAHFHDIVVSTNYDIVITPKMSFGTGHHATTQQMIMLMKSIDFSGKSVLDFGTGTGVLAILAEMLGATTILAIDNDKWSVENAIENIERNSCKLISVQEASLDDISVAAFDVILANINRHILLQYIALLYSKLNFGGTILMSGLLMEDKDIIVEAASGVGFQFVKMTELNNWIALLFKKIHS